MNTTETILTALRKYLSAMGYTIYDSVSAQLEVRYMPACRILSTKILSCTGRREQTVKHKVSLTLMNTTSSMCERAAAMRTIEGDVLALRKLLCEDSTLAAIESFKTTSGTTAQNKHSECVVDVEFESTVFVTQS